MWEEPPLCLLDERELVWTTSWGLGRERRKEDLQD